MERFRAYGLNEWEGRAHLKLDFFLRHFVQRVLGSTHPHIH
jgi:hypothetical protein